MTPRQLALADGTPDGMPADIPASPDPNTEGNPAVPSDPIAGHEGNRDGLG